MTSQKLGRRMALPAMLLGGFFLLSGIYFQAVDIVATDKLELSFVISYNSELEARNHEGVTCELIVTNRTAHDIELIGFEAHSCDENFCLIAEGLLKPVSLSPGAARPIAMRLHRNTRLGGIFERNVGYLFFNSRQGVQKQSVGCRVEFKEDAPGVLGVNRLRVTLSKSAS